MRLYYVCLHKKANSLGVGIISYSSLSQQCLVQFLRETKWFFFHLAEIIKWLVIWFKKNNKVVKKCEMISGYQLVCWNGLLLVYIPIILDDEPQRYELCLYLCISSSLGRCFLHKCTFHPSYKSCILQIEQRSQFGI